MRWLRDQAPCRTLSTCAGGGAADMASRCSALLCSTVHCGIVCWFPGIIVLTHAHHCTTGRMKSDARLTDARCCRQPRARRRLPTSRCRPMAAGTCNITSSGAGPGPPSPTNAARRLQKAPPAGSSTVKVASWEPAAAKRARAAAASDAPGARCPAPIAHLWIGLQDQASSRRAQLGLLASSQEASFAAAPDIHTLRPGAQQ